MDSFSERFSRLDKVVFDKLGDGELLIDGQSILATFDEGSLMFGDSRGTDRVLTICADQAKALGITVTRNSQLQWKGKPESMAEPPIYEFGLIKLVLV